MNEKYKFAKKLYLLFGSNFSINQIFDSDMKIDYIQFASNDYIIATQHSSFTSLTRRVTYISFTEEFYSELDKETK